MGKTLVVAEKPSVAEDYARALGGTFDKHEGFLESEQYVVSWAIGHLVGLAEPEHYDERLKRWSIKSLPILPERFQLRPDSKGHKQLGVLAELMKRGVVSLGRVQTPTLALIVSRDAQIDAFEPETYFLVEARFNLAGRDQRRYRGRWFFEKDERIPDRERAERVASAANGAACTVESV